MSRYGYNPRKAAQVVAFFAIREGGAINVLKLAKLVYLGEREHLSRHDMPILFDSFVSMDHGPVASITLNFINGYGDAGTDWESFVSDRAGYDIGLASVRVSIDALDELSDAELATLDEVWARFGAMTKYSVRDWTHKNCPEWEDPHGSSNPIPYERVLKALGKDHWAEIAESIEDARGVAKGLSYAQ